jgi:hypothetical protein
VNLKKAVGFVIDSLKPVGEDLTALTKYGDFCLHCGAKVLAEQPCLLATKMGVWSRVKEVDLVFLVLTESSLCVWSASLTTWFSWPLSDIIGAKFVPSRMVTAKLPELSQRALEIVGPVGEDFAEPLSQWRSRLLWGDLAGFQDAYWRGFAVQLRNGEELFFAIDRPDLDRWQCDAYKLAKAISRMTKAPQVQAQ